MRKPIALRDVNVQKHKLFGMVEFLFQFVATDVRNHPSLLRNFVTTVPIPLRDRGRGGAKGWYRIETGLRYWSHTSNTRTYGETVRRRNEISRRNSETPGLPQPGGDSRPAQ